MARLIPACRNLLDRLPLLLLACLAASAPLVPFHFLGSDTAVGQLTPWRLLMPLVAVLVGTLTIAVGGSRRLLERVSWPPCLLALIAVHLLASLLSASISPWPLASHAKVLYYFLTGELLCLLVVAQITSERQKEFLVGACAITATVVGTFALAEMLADVHWLRQTIFSSGNPLMLRFPDVPAWRAMATIGNPVPLGTYLSVSAPMVLYLALHARTRDRRLGWRVGLMLVLSALYLTHSRGAWFSCLVAIVIYLKQYGRKVAMLALGICLALWIGAVSADPRMASYRSIGDLGTDLLASHRSLSHGHAAAIWSQRPLLGTGTGTYGYYAKSLGSLLDTPDNMFLVVLAETGLAGLTLHLGILLVVFTRIFPRSVHDPLAWALLAGLIGFSVNMLTWDALNFPVTRAAFWLIAGLALAHNRGRPASSG